MLGLRQGQPARRLDRAQALGAVATDPSQHDGGGAVPLVVGERLEKGIDRPAVLARWRRPLDVENAAADRQRRVGGDDIDVVGGHNGAILGRNDRNTAVRGQEFDEQARVVRVEVLNQDAGDAAVGRHVIEERLEGRKSTRRRADADDEARGGRVI